MKKLSAWGRGRCVSERITDKIHNIRNYFRFWKKISFNTDFPVFLRGKKQDFRFTEWLIGKCFPKVILICIAYNNEPLRDVFILIQKIRPVLEKTLASFIEHEIIGTWIVTVIGNNEVSQIASDHRFEYCTFHVTDIRTGIPVGETFIPAASAGVNFKNDPQRKIQFSIAVNCIFICNLSAEQTAEQIKK